MREYDFPETELRYLGIQDQDDGTPNHYYLIAGEHRVCVDQIEDFEQVSWDPSTIPYNTMKHYGKYHCISSTSLCPL